MPQIGGIVQHISAVFLGECCVYECEFVFIGYEQIHFYVQVLSFGTLKDSGVIYVFWYAEGLRYLS